MKLFDEFGISLPRNMKTEYNALDHNKLFGTDKETNIMDPIIEYMIDDYNGAYVPPE